MTPLDTDNLNTLPAYYQAYINLAKDLSLMDALKNSITDTVKLLSTVPEHKGTYRYEPGKWSITEMICHMIDAERIFCYRALRFARNDKTPLHGFEENDYAPEANAANRVLEETVDELVRLRTTTIDLFRTFSDEMLYRKGIANKTEISVINIGYVIAGHNQHHLNILRQRYLTA